MHVADDPPGVSGRLPETSPGSFHGVPAHKVSSEYAAANAACSALKKVKHSGAKGVQGLSAEQDANEWNQSAI